MKTFDIIRFVLFGIQVGTTIFSLVLLYRIRKRYTAINNRFVKTVKEGIEIDHSAN